MVNRMVNRLSRLCLGLALLQALALAQWPRWEERTLDCAGWRASGQCELRAPRAKVERRPEAYRCREEPMPQAAWNPLARNSSTRLACPLGCEPDADLSVLQKQPYVNPACQKYYTYGKYRDSARNDWFLWVTEPCLSSLSTLTTHCRFKDVPFSGAEPFAS